MHNEPPRKFFYNSKGYLFLGFSAHYLPLMSFDLNLKSLYILICIIVSSLYLCLGEPSNSRKQATQQTEGAG